jgi:hypothetical protein
MSEDRATLYLQIPATYCRSFGGLRWAQYGEAVEFLEGPAAGRTFAFAAEIAVFLDGLQEPHGSVLGFGLVLHLLYLIGLADRAARHGEGCALCIERIAVPFRELGCPLRNAGALCSWLCRTATRVADPPDPAELHEILTGGSWVPQMVLSHRQRGLMDQAEEPGLTSDEFERLVRVASDQLDDGEIRHWLLHGRGPVGTADVRLIPDRPRSLVEVLIDLERSPRLAGIGRLVSSLESAISLPPRRLAWGLLQDGGYADVTTKGAPEQILPIQFALDQEEFLRRFAERELLYFHREEPRQPTTEEIVLLLDQGVRTWGDARLMLAGAAIALFRQAQRRRIAIKLATTSNGGEVIDPVLLEPRALRALVESSDLSAHPGAALLHALGSPALVRRDIVLLTHPRNVGEPAVRDAARALAEDGGARLFALSVDSTGQLELAEIRRGLPVALGQSRINLDLETAAAATPSSSPHLAQRTAWQGEIESIPFPFKCGTLDRIDAPRSDGRTHLDFDEAGERILVIGRNGLLFTWRIDGTDLEILPRPLVQGEVSRNPATAIGVAGGFVVVSRRQGQLMLAHYDFPTRTCRIHTHADGETAESWVYYRDLHCVVGRRATPAASSLAVDLAAPSGPVKDTVRSRIASKRAQKGLFPEPLIVQNVSWFETDSWKRPCSTAIHLDPKSGTFLVLGSAGAFQSFTPMRDGRLALERGNVLQARQAADVLAVLVEKGMAPGLYFLSLSRAVVLGTDYHPSDEFGTSVFALSRDGQRFARLIDDRRLDVRDVPGSHPPVLVTPVESMWMHFATLGKSCLLVREYDVTGPRRAHSCCLIRWDRGWLEVNDRGAEAVLEHLGGTVAVSREVLPAMRRSGQDPNRFVQFIAQEGARILIDRYNHIAVLRKSGDLTCMFYVNGNDVAAWLPDGTCWGSRRYIGGEPSAGAAERIAGVLESTFDEEGSIP